MTERDELVELEAERDRLRTMISYYERPDVGFPEVPKWLWHILLGGAGVIAVVVSVEMLAGEIDPALVIFLVVFLSLTAYISTRKINAFGRSVRVFDLLSYLVLIANPMPGAPELRDRLSNCEARIRQLKEGRP